MKYDPDKHHRRSVRLDEYDYSQAGLYFVTIVSWDRACLFGEIVGGEMRLNDAGRVATWEWEWMERQYHTVRLDAFIVMPNHLHGIILIQEEVGATRQGQIETSAGAMRATRYEQTGIPYCGEALPAEAVFDPGGSPLRRSAGLAPGTLGAIVGQFKSRVTKRLGRPVWQRNYYEHVIRDEDDLDRIRRYIESNPSNWMVDDENPERV